MELEFSFQTVQLFIVFVVPGLISMHIYRLLMPARLMDWAQSILQGLFYSSVNFVLLLPLLVYVHRPGFATEHPAAYWATVMSALLVMPIAWPLLLRAAFRSKWLAHRIQLPYPTAWDFYFDQRKPVFTLIHLNDGSLIGGYCGLNSFAGTSPNDGDIYLEAIYHVSSEGEFGDPIPNTQGLLLRKDQYSYIELFSANQEFSHGKAERRPLRE
jgi:Family of unknown function (DUF6338)